MKAPPPVHIWHFCWNSVLPQPHGEWFLNFLPFSANTCQYMACLLDLCVSPSPYRARLLEGNLRHAFGIRIFLAPYDWQRNRRILPSCDVGAHGYFRVGGTVCPFASGAFLTSSPLWNVQKGTRLLDGRNGAPDKSAQIMVLAFAAIELLFLRARNY